MPSLVSILNRSVFSVAFLMAGFCATAEAQDIADWQGAYWGLGAGGSYGATSSNSHARYNGYFTNSSTGGDVEQLNPILQRVIDGFDVSGSLIVGYNLQSGNLIYGLEGDLTFANFDERQGAENIQYLTSPYSRFTTSTKVESNYTLSLRSRIGYATGNMLLAFSAGPSLSTFKTTFDFSDTFGVGSSSHFKQSQTKLGVSAGASAGYRLKDGWSLRGDYVFTYFPDIVSGEVDQNGNGKNDFRFESDFQSHNLRLALIRQF